MTRIDAAELFKTISSLPKKEYNRFFLYAVEKTKTELKTHIEEIAKREYEVVYDENLRKFENERIDILERYAVKDEAGKPVIVDNKYDISPENMEIVKTETKELSDKYEADFVRVQDARKAFQEFIKEEIEVNVVKTSFKTLPENMDSDLFNVVLKLVKETDEEIQAMVG